MFKALSFLALFLYQNLYAQSMDSINKLRWDDLEVVWLEDNRYPTYSIVMYFADGALSDSPRQRGETSVMFDTLADGTRRFSQKDISDNLEFFGVTYGGYVTHEYSTYSISGLEKDVLPTMKKICHLFQDATFPVKELDNRKKQYIASLKNLVNNHSALASRAFRELSLRGTPYAYPATGKMSDFKHISQRDLKRKLDYFNKEVAKRLYIVGPKEVLRIKNVILKECGWNTSKGFVRENNYKEPKEQTSPEVYLVTVPKANQAQVRIGQFLSRDEIKERELAALASEFLGGGFTSKLMRELRVKRGLTYSVGSFAASQKEYGRAGISTFTKNETITELVEVIQNVTAGLSKGEFSEDELERAKGALAGSYPFGFEKPAAYLEQLVSLDHMGEDYKTLYRFPQIVRGFSKEQVTKKIEQLFTPHKQTIVVIGSKDLAKKLSKFGKVKIVPYEKFL